MEENQFSYTFDPAHIDSEEDQLAELYERHGIRGFLAWHKTQLEREGNEVRLDAFRQVAAALWSRGDANIKLAALAYVGGLACTENKSMAAWAREIGCSRAAISKEANTWSDKLNTRSKLMKSEQSRDTYHRRQKAVSKKRQNTSST